jgi:hypothetical protein
MRHLVLALRLVLNACQFNTAQLVPGGEPILTGEGGGVPARY